MFIGHFHSFYEMVTSSAHSSTRTYFSNRFFIYSKYYPLSSFTCVTAVFPQLLVLFCFFPGFIFK